MTDKTIYTALLEAQKSIEAITKDATAGKGSFSYNYATLGQVMDMIKKPLNDNGVFVSQPIIGDKVKTKLIFSNGSSISDKGTPIVCAKPNDPQAQGSAITYARRYGLMSILCLSTEDDDGVKAMPTREHSEIVREPLNTGECDHDWDKLPILTVVKEGSNKGRRFKSCPKCKQFKWVDTIT